MTESNALVVEKINQIKYKLNKYINLKDNSKIKDYLNVLNNIEKINVEILRVTQIVDCLKEIKKKEPANETSSLAGNIINKWKSSIASASSNDNSSTTLNSDKKKIIDKSKSTSSLSHETKKSSNGLVNGKEATNVKINQNHDQQKSSKQIKTEPLVNDDVSQSSSKKQKLSFNDYKIKKECTDDKSDEVFKSHEKSYDADNSSMKKLQQKSSSSSSSCSSSSSTGGGPVKTIETTSSESKQPLVPLPTVPLSNIITTTSTNFSLSNYTNSSSLSTYSANSKNVNIYGETDDMALERIMKSKHSKQVLYTGKKRNPNAILQAPKLFDLCVKALINSLNDLPTRISVYNMVNDFPVAFQVIKPVLERADAKQLATIEHYSPHLIVDTDPLWKKVCEKEFKNLEPLDEDENWRELYFRKLDDREDNLRRVRESIMQKRANEPQKRQTQAASLKLIPSGPKMSVYSSSSSSSSSSKTKSMSSLSTGASSMARPLGRDEPVIRLKSSNFDSKRPTKPISAPAMSQGMKATMKLLKKNMRR